MFSRIEKISHQELEHFFSDSSIFTQYISSFDKMKDFYKHDYCKLDGIKSLVKTNQISDSKRTKLYNILRDYNKNLCPSKEREKNIETLKDNNCFTVFTGQQCGLVTGPLFTIYKAITAVQLAKYLCEHNEEKFIPVFWVASEDHDLDEINQLTFPNSNGIAESLNLDLEFSGYSINDIVTENQLKSFISKLPDHWRQTEFSEKIYSLFNKKTESLSESFTYLMSYIFKDYGLVFVEPHLIRELSIDINQKALENDKMIHEIVDKSSKELVGRGLKPVLHLDEGLNFFVYNEKKRQKFYPDKNTDTYSLKDNKLSFTKEELEKIIHNEPERISQNVILRPIVQDSVFPNVATVCGPGETGYFAQLKGVYDLFQREMPVIYPRLSITLIEKKLKKVKEKFHFSTSDMINMNLDEASKSIFQDFEDEHDINQFLNNMKVEMESFIHIAEKKGKSVAQSLNSSMRKIEQELNRIKDKYLKKLEESEGLSKSQIERLKNNITPKSKPQERVFNYFYFVNFYGDTLIDELVQNSDIRDFRHQVLFYE